MLCCPALAWRYFFVLFIVDCWFRWLWSSSWRCGWICSTAVVWLAVENGGGGMRVRVWGHTAPPPPLTEPKCDPLLLCHGPGHTRPPPSPPPPCPATSSLNNTRLFLSLSLAPLCKPVWPPLGWGQTPSPTFPVPVRLMARHGGWTCRQWWETEAPLVAPGLVGGRLWNPPPRRADPGRVPPAERHREIERGRGRKTL